MRKLLLRTITLAGVAWFSQAEAQISTRIDQYYQDLSLINPAMLNSYSTARLSLFYNQLFTGIPGHPENLALSALFPNTDKRVGFGINLGQERIGFSTLQNVYTNYAYTLPFKNNVRLHTGLSLGLLSQRFNPNAIDVIDPTDVIVQSLQQGRPDNRIDLKASLALQMGGFSVGISSGRLNAPKFQYEYLNKNFNFRALNNTSIFSSAKFMVQENFYLQPILCVHLYDFKNPLFQYGMNFNYREAVWLGVHSAGYGNLSLHLGGSYHQTLRFGYAFTTPLSNQSKLLSSGHEFFTALVLGKTNELVKRLPNDQFVFNGKNNEVGDSSDASGKGLTGNNQTVKVESIKMKNDTIVISAFEEMKFIKTGLDTAKIVFRNLNKAEYPRDGYYVVVGVFKFEDNADRAIKINYARGITAYKFYFPDNGYYYVYIFRGDSPEEADEVKWQETLETPDVWTKRVYRKPQN